MIRTKRITYCGVLTALAMIFSYVEALIPIPIGIPGVKLGVANIAIICVIYIVGDIEGMIVNIVRIILTGMLFGNLYSFLFSLAGGLLSVIVMILMKKSKQFSVIAVSVVGAVTHNIGQILAAVILMENLAIAYYIPVLIIAGMITGIVIGSVAGLATDRVKRILG